MSRNNKKLVIHKQSVNEHTPIDPKDTVDLQYHPDVSLNKKSTLEKRSNGYFKHPIFRFLCSRYYPFIFKQNFNISTPSISKIIINAIKKFYNPKVKKININTPSIKDIIIKSIIQIHKYTVPIYTRSKTGDVIGDKNSRIINIHTPSISSVIIKTIIVIKKYKPATKQINITTPFIYGIRIDKVWTLLNYKAKIEKTNIDTPNISAIIIKRVIT